MTRLLCTFGGNSVIDRAITLVNCIIDLVSALFTCIIDRWWEKLVNCWSVDYSEIDKVLKLIID